VSMLDSDILVKLNELAKKIKRNDKPFGGMQVIICGDFLQLPPISNKANSANLNYCFKSHAWEEIIHTNIVLTKVFRQEGDSDLIDVLNALRVGQVDYKVESKLRQLSRPLKFDDGIEPTELFPTRAEVERSNQFRLMQLEGKEIEYIGKDTLDGNIQPDSNTKKSFESMMCVQSLKLKLGAQVILLKNDLYPELVNGQLGMIEAFLTKPVFLSYSARLGADNSSEKDRILAKISQIILKRRGFTDAEDAEDLSFFTDFQADLIREILGSYDDKDEILPHVRFIMPNSDRQVKFLIERQMFSPMEGPHAYTIRREQLPINLSWAISIHKSQGQTLPRVKVDLARIFEKGQLYVAISRCVSSKGLQVLNFDRRKVFVDGEVVNFYNEILRTRHLETVNKEDDQ
jgi:ATP-dependent DNA helicase PIF1